MSEYSQGVCGDGASILKDGEAMTVDEIVDRLQQMDAALEKISSPSQSKGLLWWQIEAREALSPNTD